MNTSIGPAMLAALVTAGLAVAQPSSGAVTAPAP